MGIDAMIWVETPKPLTEKALAELNAKAASLGSPVPWIADGPAINPAGPPPEWADEPVQPNVPHQRLYYVSTMQRFSGEGYPRGPAKAILDFLLWLEAETGGRAWYGSDQGHYYRQRDEWEPELEAVAADQAQDDKEASK